MRRSALVAQLTHWLKRAGTANGASDSLAPEGVRLVNMPHLSSSKID